MPLCWACRCDNAPAQFPIFRGTEPMNPLYAAIYRAGRTLRSQHYGLYRGIVENKVVRTLLNGLFGRKTIRVASPEGTAITVNPIYHGNFLTPQGIAEYEPEMRELFARLVEPGMVVYDVGANVGVFSVLFAALAGPHGLVYAFEPEPGNLRCLRDTQSNNALPNLVIQAAGVGRENGTLYFDRKGGAMSGRMVEKADRSDANIIEMPVIGIDDFVFVQGQRAPDLLKIDVEGNEVNVVAGMNRTLTTHRPIVVCELHPAAEPKVLDLFSVFASHGYESYDASRWLRATQPQALHAYAGVHHVLCIPTD